MDWLRVKYIVGGLDRKKNFTCLSENDWQPLIMKYYLYYNAHSTHQHNVHV